MGGQLGGQAKKVFCSECDVSHNPVFGTCTVLTEKTDRPVERVVVWGEALHHEVLDNNEVIQNILPSYF